MSRIVATLVYSKVIGSSVRKAVLAYIADRANDDGSGIWCSKQTIADETEVARSTVIKTINEFVAEGLLTQTGTRRCANGATIEYAVNIDGLRRLPDVQRDKSSQGVRQPDPKPSASRTSPDMDPSATRTPPVRQPDPKPSASRTQTVLEPSLNQKEEPDGSSKKRASRLSKGWLLPKDWGDWAVSEGLSADLTRREADKFRDYWTGKSGAAATKLDWQATWRNWVRNALDRMAPPNSQQNDPDRAKKLARWDRIGRNAA